jgi:hypothetical protein
MIIHLIDRIDVFKISNFTFRGPYIVIYSCNKCQQDALISQSQHDPYDTYLLLCVQCWTPDDGRRNCPKHVEFYSKNKFEKIVRLVGFIIRISNFSFWVDWRL